MNERRPSWLHERCPAWCTREHHEGDHPEDRLHRSAGVDVPVVLGRGDLPHDYRPEPAVLTIRRHRAVDDVHEWVTIQESEGRSQRLVLDAAGLQTLRAAL